jgi:hypothetical protein
MADDQLTDTGADLPVLQSRVARLQALMDETLRLRADVTAEDRVARIEALVAEFNREKEALDDYIEALQMVEQGESR